MPYKPPATAEEKLLVAKVRDAVQLAERTGKPRFTGFLNEREQQLAAAALGGQHWAAWRFAGGHESAERAMLCVFDSEEAPPAAPICRLAVQAAFGAPGFTHRDVLGALLALGVARHCVGDILVGDAGATVFVEASVSGLVCDELRQVGRQAVRVTEAAPDAPLAAPDAGEEQTASVASLRLDAVLAAMLHQSRGAVAMLIRSERVQVNHIGTASVHQLLAEGDVLSVRGIGRFRLAAIGGQSRKNRTFVRYIRY